MADRYYDYNDGNVGNDGSTPALAKATRSQAVTASTGGDAVIAVDGTHIHESGHFVFDDDRIETAENYRESTLQANAAETTRVARTSGSLAAANNPFTCSDLIFDGQSGSGGEVTQSFDIAQDAAEDIITQFHNCHWIAGATHGLLISNRRGRVEIVNGKISGTPASRFIASTSNLAGDGNQVIDIQTIELQGSVSANSIGIALTKINNLTNTFDVALKGLSGVIAVGTGVTYTLVDINGCDTPVVSGFDFTLNVDDAATVVTGILCRGQSTAIASDVTISAGIMKFNSPVGFAISLGQSTIASNVTGGTVNGCKVVGKHYASATPHNFVIGQAVTGSIKGCVSQDGYVAYLVSKTTLGTVTGNLAYDCYGPSYYVKGTTDCVVQDNIAVVTTKFPQRDRGVLAVAPQGATNTVAATIQENLVIVTDVSNIHSLGYIEDVNQVCSFVRNTYIIPDTVDVSSALLFSYENGAGGAVNNTLAQWNAQTEVTDDVIIQMPQSEINRLAASLKPKFGGLLPSSMRIGL